MVDDPITAGERIADALEAIANKKPTLWQVDVDGRLVLVHGEGGRDYLRYIDALVRTLRSQLANAVVDRILDQ